MNTYVCNKNWQGIFGTTVDLKKNYNLSVIDSIQTSALYVFAHTCRTMKTMLNLMLLFVGSVQ